MKRLRDLYYYLGRDKKHNYPATPVSNMIMFDTAFKWSQTSAFTHNLIIRLIQEYNPRDLDISLVTMQNGVHADFTVWGNAITGQRIIPQIESILYLEDNQKEVENYISTLFEKVSSVKEVDKRHIIIIDWIDRFVEVMSDETRNTLLHLIIDGSKSGYYFVFLASNYDTMSEFVSAFDTVATLSTTEEFSQQLFGTDIAAPTFSKNQVFVRHKDSDVEVLYIPFYPDTWIEKFCRYYGVVNEVYING